VRELLMQCIVFVFTLKSVIMLYGVVQEISHRLLVITAFNIDGFSAVTRCGAQHSVRAALRGSSVTVATFDRE